MPNSASGTNRDKQGRSFVDSPLRGDKFTAQEVFIGNQGADAIPVSIVSGGGGGGNSSGLPFDWDAFTIDKSAATENVYNYTNGGNPSGTVTITYTDTSKCEISGGSIVSI